MLQPFQGNLQGRKTMTIFKTYREEIVALLPVNLKT